MRQFSLSFAVLALVATSAHADPWAEFEGHSLFFDNEANDAPDFAKFQVRAFSPAAR